MDTSTAVSCGGKPLNVLLITSDQQHHDTLGFANPRIRTPHLDRLAREGMNFERAYTNNPVCTPSRATIITGLYPSWHGAWTIGVKLPEDVPTVGELFQSAGYYTALVGKAHFHPLRSDPDGPGGVSLECQPILRDLDFWGKFTGPWYGFERIELARNHADESHVGQHYALWMEAKGLTNWRDYFVAVDPRTGHGAGPSRRGPWELPQEYHYTTWTGERTIANIEQSVKAGKPFFIWSSFHDPHPPYTVSEPWASMYKPEDMAPGELDKNELKHMSPIVARTREEHPDFAEFRDPDGHANHGLHSHVHEQRQLKQDMAIYYGMVSFMDDQIGRILETLDRLGIADNTLVVFTTDHGHYLGQHGLVAKGPFMYDDGIRLPFIVRWPGQTPAGASSRAFQTLVDLAPTFLSACGIKVPGLMQGVSQADVWRGQAQAARDHVIVEHRHQPRALHLRTFINDRYKITVFRGHEWGELYDLREDPGEKHNRWDDPKYAPVKAELFQQWVMRELEREPTRMARIAVA